MTEEIPRFPLKEEGKAADFNRWCVELVVKLAAIAAGVGVVLYFLSLSLEQQKELLQMHLNALQRTVDTSLGTQKVMLETALNTTAASFSEALSEQQSLLDRSLQGQIANQQRLDRIRLVNVLKQIRGECVGNMDHVTNGDRYGLPGMKLQLELKDETVLTSYCPEWRFKTTIWEIANTKDYFIAHKPQSMNDIASVYEKFYRFNRFADEFNGQVLLMRSIAGREGHESLEFRNTFRFTDNLKNAANEILDSLESARREFDDKIVGDIQPLEGKNGTIPR
jgi:hypothetical protein